MKWIKILRSIYSGITSTRAAGIYILLFAISIGAATFVENDFGTSSAQKIIFKAWWFEALLLLFSLTIFTNIRRFRMIRQKKWAALIFHSAIIIIIAGAGITRYFGYEGMMHIRENSDSNIVLSSESFLNFNFENNSNTYSFNEYVNFATLGKNYFDESYQIGSNVFQVRLKEFIPNPKEELFYKENAPAVVKVVFGGEGGREEYFIRQGEKMSINNVNFNFTNSILPNAFNIFYRNDSLSFITDKAVNQMVMATQIREDIPAGTMAPLRLRAMYNNGNAGFVFGDFNAHADTKLVAESRKMKSESYAGLLLEVIHEGKKEELLIAGRKGEQGLAKSVNVGTGNLNISYGPKEILLPFSIKLKDFIMDRYPGTDNPSSYASEVTLLDPAKGVNMDFRIFMNNILTYQGYRFFQSSFDQDEAGTILSVNHDFWGTWTSYLGYFLLTVGLLFTFFDKRSRFTSLSQKLKQYQTNSLKSIILIFITMLSLITSAIGQEWKPESIIESGLAKEFGKIVVQDHKGRLKPANTMTSEVMRKLSRKESMFGMTSDQLFLSILTDPQKWQDAPLIFVSDHPQIKKLLGQTEKYLTYRQFYDKDGNYKLRDEIRKAQMMNPKDQGTFEKAIIKTDEKVNIANMVFSGRLLKIYPVPGDLANTWISPADVRESNSNSQEIMKMDKIFVDYMQSFQHDHNVDPTGQILKIKEFQQKYGAAIYPSDSKISAELLFNSLDIFGRLKNIYGLSAIIILGLFFYSVFKSTANRAKITRYVFYFLCFAFAFQTLGLALRWYISGRAPWSNGYESMIYISWTTMLAGLIFSRKSLGGMAATTILAATVLLVAAMSWLDPEISPLVPVLKSYWLTIHVSLEAGSYGFLMLGAVIGMLNLILYSLNSQKKKVNIERTIKELTVISEITLLAGLVMVSIGTYLGGVWANESWGRYWGWDAKETWALVTILVYAFILHMRFIPGIQSAFAFNVASLFGFATVIMTYFGVNYYLSGLHSYAAGDPVPIPPQVFYTTIALIALTIVAYINYRRIYQKNIDVVKS